VRARIRTKTYVIALGTSAALLLAGCASVDGTAGVATNARGTLHLQPVADAGPDPFTKSTSASESTPPPVTRTPQPSPSGSASAGTDGLTQVSGATPGLYGGTRNRSSCDVEKQVRFLTSDQAKAGAFAQAGGIKKADVATFLRGLTPVLLTADTRVTNHGYRDGRATSFQSVLEAGTAVLVDQHGMPRVRCTCGNPVAPPTALKGSVRQQGSAWPGYRPRQVIVIVAAPTVIQNLTIINIVDHTWIERQTGDDGSHDKQIPKPTPTPTSPSPTPTSSSPSPSPSTSSPTPTPSSPTPSPSDSGASDTPAPDTGNGTVTSVSD
jgi:hypothetical protein